MSLTHPPAASLPEIEPGTRDTGLDDTVLARQLEHVWGTPRTLLGWLSTVDHKHIGRR
jgi:hypothetical protein